MANNTHRTIGDAMTWGCNNMISALVSFFGGSVFRMVWGEISSFIDKKQEHKQEIEHLRLIEELDQAKHKREIEMAKLQAENGIQILRVQGEKSLNEVKATAWGNVVESTTKQTGVKWVDAWNAAIRPGGATWAFAILTLEAFALVNVTNGTLEVAWAFLGLFVADRALGKRGK